MVDFQKRDTHRGTEPSDGGDDTGGSGADGRESDSHGHDDERAHKHPHDDGRDTSAIEDPGIAVVTVSSTHTAEDDASGDAIVAACGAAGGSVEARNLIPDDYDQIQETIGSLIDHPAVDVVVTTGGTGVTPDDVTTEAARPLFEKELPGFGELFRRYSEAEIGTRVVATRATAGIVDGTPVFCLPGSEHAAKLGIEEIVLPEAGHLVGLAQDGWRNEAE